MSFLRRQIIKSVILIIVSLTSFNSYCQESPFVKLINKAWKSNCQNQNDLTIVFYITEWGGGLKKVYYEDGGKTTEKYSFLKHRITAYTENTVTTEYDHGNGKVIETIKLDEDTDGTITYKIIEQRLNDQYLIKDGIILKESSPVPTAYACQKDAKILKAEEEQVKKQIEIQKLKDKEIELMKKICVAKIREAEKKCSTAGEINRCMEMVSSGEVFYVRREGDSFGQFLGAMVISPKRVIVDNFSCHSLD